MGKKQRDPKERLPPPPPKDEAARRADMDNIKQKLEEANLAADLARITDIFQRMDVFVKTGEADTGSIPLEGYKRTLDYIFTPKGNVHSSMKLRYTG
jgi:hypothetical protein